MRSVAAWAAAAVAAVAVASWGVDHVGRSVTDSRPAPLSAAQVEARAAAIGSSTTTAAPVATTSPGATPTTSQPPGAVTTTSAVIPGGTDVAPEPPPAPTTTAPPVTAAPAPAETRTYALVGGTASLRFEPTGVTVVFANPAAGFEVEVEPEHTNGVRVEFESETHRSRVTGWWDGGPRDQVDERADDD